MNRCGVSGGKTKDKAEKNDQAVCQPFTQFDVSDSSISTFFFLNLPPPAHPALRIQRLNAFFLPLLSRQ